MILAEGPPALAMKVSAMPGAVVVASADDDEGAFGGSVFSGFLREGYKSESEL